MKLALPASFLLFHAGPHVAHAQTNANPPSSSKKPQSLSERIDAQIANSNFKKDVKHDAAKAKLLKDLGVVGKDHQIHPDKLKDLPPEQMQDLLAHAQYLKWNSVHEQLRRAVRG
jgi:hypothetical protein